MNQDPIIFALANLKPEIEPAPRPSQWRPFISNWFFQISESSEQHFSFSRSFKGLLAPKGRKVDVGLQMTVARSLAAMISEPTAEKFIPNVFDGGVVDTVLMLY